ncbi:conserved Plasmodium protein, unknown function [Plasmodium knowlesi strain H]|uniref:Uncharacterized protein n=3 Tax=Plasmodium knowlesi TaxID=5850 RepID=A0A5K1UWZ9_PLAKH|nr:conserved Plasmodium protein, unknown function [Plasmodium knowlesi strain H]OTN64884.1 Uncharacterized protein PKNOH_S120156400 [Plasmodium knowlesi]CAA9988420.1 conserved Plasmodium protein, unknown function [Plasmodium knowlesi strain H]SBO19893.1 conserved Plasmodium protein, unknown function [Plasmodium knowlesi strain H]SBO20398.1 conserved Plasmodium protein, unknown function [Plasmodium knowlesi strain H]VVS77894.1 conserved Plasmodium protein, unknown function [Plasmodium knowlesi |eukprot:XP_002259401.1 hypothetical protein, conserved in Plasmodium species [Plasmodium knowlesi strain H]
MYADRIQVACYGDKKIPSKLKYFFEEDLYELSDVKLDERINLLRIHLKYVFYDNPLSEYFKNEGNLLSEKSLIYIYFLCLNNLEEYRNEKEYILNRYKDTGNDEHEECIIIYAYNLEDNMNEIKNIKKIKADFSHNNYKSIKILSLPILKNEYYDDSNNKMKELYEHFKIRYMDHLKICIEKKYHMIRSGYTKSMTNFLNLVDHSKKLLGEKKKKNSQKSKFHLTDFMYQVDSGQEENQILEFVNFYKKHNVFLFCNEFVDINFFLKKNDLFSYMNEIEFVTDYDEELYIELYDNFLLLFIWCENLCLLFCKLNLFKKSYVLYSAMAKLFIKHLNVFVKKKKCIIHSSILFEKNYLTLARYIRERNICSIHLLEYIFFKKFSLLLFLNKFSYLSSKALRFAHFFYTNKIFIFMHNFSRFKNSVIRNSTQISYLKNIQRKVTKYRHRDLLGRVSARVSPPGGARRGESQIVAQGDLVEEEEEEDNPKSDQNSSLEHAPRDATPREHSPFLDKNVGKRRKSLISEFKEVFRKGVGNVDSAVRAGGHDDAGGEPMGQGAHGPDEDNLQDNNLKGDNLKGDNLKGDNLKGDNLKEENLKEDYLQDDGLLDEDKLVSESPEKTTSNDLSTRPDHIRHGDHLGEFPDERDKITFLLKCCFMNKENYFAVYFYNMGNLIKFLFERRSTFYQEEQKKNQSDKSVKKNNTNISKYLSLQKNIMKLGYKKNFSKKKKSKKSLKIKTKRSNSLNESSTSQLSSTLSEPSDGKNDNYSFYQHNDFCINVSKIFNLSFVILKNIMNIYRRDKLFEQRNAKKVYLLNFFLHYLEEKQFEKNMLKEELQQVKNEKKNVYHTFPIYHIKYFSKNNEKEKKKLLVSIMYKITNLCYRKYGNIAMINKFFLAIILFENSKYNKSMKILKKIIQKCNQDFVIFFCMQLISLHKVNNQFYHFCSSFFLSNKYTPICSFKDVNINFFRVAHYEDYLFFRHAKNSLLQIEQDKCYGNDFFSSLGKDIVVSYRKVMQQVFRSVDGKGGMHLSTVHTEPLHERRGMIQRGPSREGEQIDGNSRKEISRGNTSPTDVNINKVINFERKVFYQNNYYFKPNVRFLKSLRKFNFSVSKNEEQSEIHIPHSDVKIFVQSNYNLYLFASNMLFGNMSEVDNAEDPSRLPHIGTLLRLKIEKYAQKQGKGTGKGHPPRVKQLCVQYDENIDLFIFSALSQDLLIDKVMIELYDERANKKLHLNFAKNKYVIKTGLNIIKLNISSILENSIIEWKNFFYKINYVFLQVNHFCFYQQLGILPNGNILTPFLNAYTEFIKSNYILSRDNKYASFFLDQLVSPLYIKIKTLQSVLNCQLVASYLNNSSLVYNSTNYIKLIVSNYHRHVDSREENEFISTQRNATKGGPHVDIPSLSTSNQIKNVHLLVHKKNEGSDLQYLSQKCTVPDSVFFVIESNDHVEISEPKILKREHTSFAKPGQTNDCSVEKEEGNYHDKCDYDQAGQWKKDSYAIISFIPVRANNSNVVKREEFQLNLNCEKNLQNFDSPDEPSSNDDHHSRNNSNEVKVKCVINIDLEKKKKRQRKTDLCELSNVNYIGQTKFDDFINLEKDSSYHPPFNNQIVIDKTFHLANIFNEKIKTYRSKNTILYELILKLHKDNYSVFLKNFHVSIRKKYDTDITGAKIFLLNGKNGDFVRSSSRATGDNSSNDMAQLQAYTLGAQPVEPVKREVEGDVMEVKESMKGSVKDDMREEVNREMNETNDLDTSCAIGEGGQDTPPPGADTPNESDASNVNLWSANNMQESGASSLSLLSANDLNEEGGGKRNTCNEVSYFYDEIDVNRYIHGGMSVFFLFEVTYRAAQGIAVDCNGTNSNNNSDDGTEERSNDRNNRDSDRNGTIFLMDESMTTGTLCVTYEYRNSLIVESFEEKPKEYIYTLDVPIPSFLLPINVDYDIPKYGTLHTLLNVKIVLWNNMGEDIYMKYFVYLEERKKKGQSEGDDEYNWLINGFKKKVVFLPKNSSHVINLIILPLKIGLINFPPILYYIKLNDSWVEVTEVLKKSENFQLIISPSLQFSPKVWQLA